MCKCGKMHKTATDTIQTLFKQRDAIKILIENGYDLMPELSRIEARIATLASLTT